MEVKFNLCCGAYVRIALCSSQLIASAALIKYSKICSGILYFSAIDGMTDELSYACTSLANGDNGDWACIAKNGKTHLLLAGAAFIAECALGIFAAEKTANADDVCDEDEKDKSSQTYSEAFTLSLVYFAIQVLSHDV